MGGGRKGEEREEKNVSKRSPCSSLSLFLSLSPKTPSPSKKTLSYLVPVPKEEHGPPVHPDLPAGPFRKVLGPEDGHPVGRRRRSLGGGGGSSGHRRRRRRRRWGDLEEVDFFLKSARMICPLSHMFSPSLSYSPILFPRSTEIIMERALASNGIQKKNHRLTGLGAADRR